MKWQENGVALFKCSQKYTDFLPSPDSYIKQFFSKIKRGLLLNHIMYLLIRRIDIMINNRIIPQTARMQMNWTSTPITSRYRKIRKWRSEKNRPDNTRATVAQQKIQYFMREGVGEYSIRVILSTSQCFSIGTLVTQILRRGVILDAISFPPTWRKSS